jgi:replicative DNA helicase
MPEREGLDVFEGGLQPMQHWADKARRKLDLWRSGVPEGYSTGFPDIDRYLRLVGGELTIIAARTSQGKTAIAMQMAETVAQTLEAAGDEGCVAIFSAEMGGDQLLMRMASARCGVSSHKLRNGRGTSEELDRYAAAIDTIQSLQIWIDDGGGPTTKQMLERLRALHVAMPVRLMLFDFVELGRDQAHKEEHLRIGEIVHNLKGIAKTLDIPVIALSQVNRDSEKTANKMPSLADLRSSGMIEQLADAVLFVVRPDYYLGRGIKIDVPSDFQPGMVYVPIAKNRNGPVGMARLHFDAQRAAFQSLERREILD